MRSFGSFGSSVSHPSRRPKQFTRPMRRKAHADEGVASLAGSRPPQRQIPEHSAQRGRAVRRFPSGAWVGTLRVGTMEGQELGACEAAGPTQCRSCNARSPRARIVCIAGRHHDAGQAGAAEEVLQRPRGALRRGARRCSDRSPRRRHRTCSHWASLWGSGALRGRPRVCSEAGI